jgi:hypothetical protein
MVDTKALPNVIKLKWIKDKGKIDNLETISIVGFDKIK